ncbi:MAG: nucleoside triphosphate pyrophosphohydrolase [Tissierellia bacterium]|nr:nucleoside triphosphate pyrophosphohydrolase [Tissierellia bacterium]
MGKIHVIGLGPSDEKALTLGALEQIHGKGPHFIRTKYHETITYFEKHNIPYTSFDYIYEEEDSFDDIYKRVVNELLTESKERDINYYVPGNPFIAEKTVALLLESGVELEIVPGMSFIEPILGIVKRDPVEGLQIIDGDSFHRLDLDIHRDTMITQVYNSRILSQCKIAITELYGDNHYVYLIKDGGIPGKEEVAHIPAHSLDQSLSVNHQTSIYLPKRKDQDGLKDWKDLYLVTEALRGEYGCPWDMEQTHESIAGDLIEEAYETVHALRYGSLDDFIEELGDVLFQIFFHSQIGYEEGEFFLEDVITSVTNKLIYRHPHVFQGTSLEDNQWDRLKYEKKDIYSFSDKLKDIVGLPALLRCGKVIDKVTKIGFQWEEVEGILEKVQEEYCEVVEAIGEGKEHEEHLIEELGDLLFTCTNLCRYLGYNAEDILQQSTDKFIRRFEKMEDLANKRNLEFESLGLEKLDSLWNEVKENS